MKNSNVARRREIQYQHQNDVPPPAPPPPPPPPPPTSPSPSKTPTTARPPPSASTIQVLKKYTTAMMQLRTMAEQLHNVRPFYFDNYVLVQYFQQQHQSNSSQENNLGDHQTGGNGSGSGFSFSAPSAASMAYIKLELLKQIRDRRRQILFYLMLIFLFFLAFPAHEVAMDRGMRFVYPGMRMWRRITLPLVERFPRLTELYDETCLMGNPFFQVMDLSCDSCARVQTVHDYSRQPEHHQQQSADADEQRRQRSADDELVPFIFKINQTPIQLDDFYKLYTNNYKIFQRDAYRVQSTSNQITNLQELFNQFNNTQPDDADVGADDTAEHTSQTTVDDSRQTSSSAATTATARTLKSSHNLWRCNRMLPARLLRQLFVRPREHLPETGIALERYMAIDTPSAASYTLPETECANVFIQQALGTRFIILRPTSECRHKCRTLSIRLPQSFVLSYNWWYWKPISAPDPLADTLSISLIGSYC